MRFIPTPSTTLWFFFRFIKCKVQISIGTQIIRQYIYITQTIGIKQKREREKKGRRKKDTDNAGALIFYTIPLTLNSCHLIDYKIYSKNTLCLIYLFTLFHRQTIQFNWRNGKGWMKTIDVKNLQNMTIWDSQSWKFINNCFHFNRMPERWLHIAPSIYWWTYSITFESI